MHRFLLFSFLFCGSILLSSCEVKPQLQAIKSPDNRISLEPFLDAKGQFGYRLFFNEEMILDSSLVGLEFHRQELLRTDLELIFVEAFENETEWEQPWGEQRIIRDNHHGLHIGLQETKEPFRAFSLEFRVFNDGMGFRYHVASDNDSSTFRLMEEHSSFQLTEDPICWWQPGDWDIYEHLYTESRFSEIDALKYRNTSGLAQTYIPHNAVNTPVTMKLSSGTHISFHEAALTDYAGMTLKVEPKENRLTSCLVGSNRVPWKVERKGDVSSPWRTIIISEDAKGLLSSTLTLNLNEPSKIEETSWLEPMLYAGIWWEMHLGTHSWDLASGKHGATTERAKEHIDFCAENGIKALLIEGWNTGWENWLGADEREGIFDFVSPYPDYDLNEVIEYAREKGVQIIMHHETSAAIETYENQLDTAFKLMRSLGIQNVKTGYVGKVLPKGEFHHGQFMVQHYRKVLETAAKYQIAIDAHEPIKPTGIRRTWPNMMTREGLRGQEFNAWSPDGGNPPNHLPTVAFTRMLAGPIDYTPGVVQLDLRPYGRNQIKNTIAHQLAAYIVIYSPLQMVPDLIENYRNEAISLEFIKSLKTDWEKSIPLSGEVGQHIVVARKARDSESWFIGGLNAENNFDKLVTLDFLDVNRTYELIFLTDNEETDLDENATEFLYTSGTVQQGNKLAVTMKRGGGFVAVLHPMNQ